MIIINSSFYSDSENDTPNNNLPLLVTSSGHHVLTTLSKFDTVRPNGRRDFQLIYVRKGRIRYTINNENLIAEKGSILLYKPFEPQYYTYYLEDSPDIYWVHYTGSEAENYLKCLNLFEKPCYELSTNDEYEKLFNKIIQELQTKTNLFSELSTLYFQTLIYLISRSLSIKMETEVKLHPEIEKAIHIFNTRYREQFNIGEFAKSCNMSVSWFTHLFNQQMKISPQRYITQIRIEKAKALLSSTNNINEIAAIIGYQDSLYFSRVFKQITGLSPTQYKNQFCRLPATPPSKAPWNKK